MSLKKIISGGQTGVDIAALRAAKAVGLGTGGAMPNGFRTLAGNKPEYADLYGMTQTASRDWTPRTRANVEAADVTLFIGLRSAGYYATRKAATQAGKEFIHAFPRVLWAGEEAARAFAEDFLTGYPDWQILNIAGNRDADEQTVEAWLVALFGMLREGDA